MSEHEDLIARLRQAFEAGWRCGLDETVDEACARDQQQAIKERTSE